MENEDDLTVLTALLDDDSNDILTDAVEELEKSNSESPKSTSLSPLNSKSTSVKNSKEKPHKEAQKLVITKNPRQKRKADYISKEESSKDKDNSMWDKFSGLNVINPLISSVSMSTKMEGRKFIPVSKISDKVKGKDVDYDWVTTAVLAKKIPPKTSSNGKTYGIWKLSDLGITSANNTVALFLFGEVYKTHWKISEGSVIAILNANILPAKEKNSQELALCLDNPQKLMLVGISKDFGHCLGHTRKDGKPCSNIVNKQYGEFCEYHVNTAYKKVKSKRMEFQSSSGPPKGQLMKKLQKDMSSSTFMYQGKMLQVNSPAPQKSKSVTLTAIQNASKAKLPSSIKEKVATPKVDNSKPSEYFLDLLSVPTVGTRNLSKYLHDEKEQSEAKSNPSKASASQLLKSYRKELKNPRPPSTNDAPMLGRGLEPGGDIFFSKSSRKAAAAKNRALFIIQQKGPIDKVNPNAVKKKTSPLLEKSVEQRVESNLEKTDDSDVSPKQTKKRRLLGPEFEAFNSETEEGKRLIKAKSLHVGQVEAAQAERQEKYFNELEKKENMEEKMKSIKEISVAVFCCKKCDYVAESASDICYKQNHPIKKTTALKRFFACKQCGERTISYGSKIPKLTCANCGEMNYQRTSMLIERKGPKIAGETLLVRGIEHPKYLQV